MQRISQETLTFLSQLKKHNNREWFNENKPQFKEQESQVKAFASEVTQLLNKHDNIQKTKQFRIYRDVRFSKDKTPYKSHFGIHFERKKPELRGGYYLHIEPGDRSFVDVGFWSPDKTDINRVRKEWELDAGEVKSILNNPVFKRYWGEMHGEQLKSSPAGFDKNHPDITLINYKQWLFQHPFTDREVLDQDFALVVDEYFRQVRPFFDYMSEVLTTDLNGVSLI